MDSLFLCYREVRLTILPSKRGQCHCCGHHGLGNDKTEKRSSFTSSGLIEFLKDECDVMSYAVFGHQEMEHCIRRRRSLKFKKRAVPVSELQSERELQFKCYVSTTGKRSLQVSNTSTTLALDARTVYTQHFVHSYSHHLNALSSICFVNNSNYESALAWMPVFENSFITESLT